MREAGAWDWPPGRHADFAFTIDSIWFKRKKKKKKEREIEIIQIFEGNEI